MSSNNRDKILSTDILLSRVAMTRHHGCVFYHFVEIGGWRIRVPSNWGSSLVCSWLVKGGLVLVCVPVFYFLLTKTSVSVD